MKSSTAWYVVSFDDVRDFKRKNGRAPWFQCIKGHFRECWLLYLILTTILTLAICFMIVYVGYPAIAQLEVNQAKITLTQQTVRNPRPDSIDLDVTALLLTGSPFIPEFQAFNSSFHLPNINAPFLIDLTIPPFRGANSTTMRIQQHVYIDSDNYLPFAAFSAALLHNKNVTFDLLGNDVMRLGALPKTSVFFSKTITIPGFNNLEGLSLTNLSILRPVPASSPDGANALGKIRIPNQSNFTLPLGNLTQLLYVDDTFIGNSTLPDLTLVPGVHEYDIRLTADQEAVVSLLKIPDYACGKMPVTVVQQTSMVDGEVIPYFTHALRQANQSLEIDLAPAFEELGLGDLLGKNCSAVT